MSTRVLKQKKVTKEKDGTIVEEEINYAIKTKTEAFIMIFANEIGGLNQLRSVLDCKLLFILADKAEFNTGIVKLTTNTRKEIADSLGITPQSITNSLCRLKTAGLIAGTGGDYSLNPYFIWKGTTNARNKLIKETNKDKYESTEFTERPSDSTESGEHQTGGSEEA
jgi:DNA-binding MarR family transcriptional regulator